LEYDFRLAPGVDADVIRLSFEGADEVRTDEAGNLVLRVGGRELVHQAPKVYQWIDGERLAVAARYRTFGPSALCAAQIAFAVAEHDPNAPLVIDPVVVETLYEGQSEAELGNGIARDLAGNLYVTGWKQLMKFTAEGQILWTIPIPMEPGFFPLRPVVDNSGSVYVFAYYPSSPNNTISKFDTDGQIIWSTLLDVYPSNIAVDGAGNVYMTGATDNEDFPTTSNAYSLFI